jgi:hypothetical protein
MTNPFEVYGRVVRMEVWHRSRQLFCWFDTADLQLAQSYSGLWYANPARAPSGKYYVMAKFWDPAKKQSKSTMFHRVILGLTDPEIEGHHKDNDGLNNRRDNLVAVSHKVNMRERSPNRDWQWLDAARDQAAIYRAERIIATAIQKQFELTRAALWKIRVGHTKGSCAARAYRDAIDAEHLQTLAQLQESRPKSGKWGISTSGMLRAPEL